VQRVGIPRAVENLRGLVDVLLVVESLRALAGGQFPTHAPRGLVNPVHGRGQLVVMFNVVADRRLLVGEVFLPVGLGPGKFSAIVPVVVEQPVGFRIGHVRKAPCGGVLHDACRNPAGK
jgi:hypothetical protein